MNYSCPGCGAQLTRESVTSVAVACRFCGQTSFILPTGPVAHGMKGSLLEAPTLYPVGSRGTFEHRSFTVRGRVRYHYESGAWEEKFLEFDDGRHLWLSEDEGNLSVFGVEALQLQPATLKPWESYVVGGSFSIKNEPFSIEEKGECVVAGVSGELPRGVATGQGFYFLDGIAQGKVCTVNYYRLEIEAYLGKSIRSSDINITQMAGA